jgi:hypothetical protein
VSQGKMSHAPVKEDHQIAGRTFSTHWLSPYAIDVMNATVRDKGKRKRMVAEVKETGAVSARSGGKLLLSCHLGG